MEAYIPEEEIKLIDSLFEQPRKAFSAHLGITGNKRILFSGPYGSGKTTFLDNYFSQPEASGGYEVIHLFPVNYSVAANEDIFRYIKFDIIYSLLLKKVSLTNDEIPLSIVAYFYMVNKIPDLVKFLVSLTSEKGKVAVTIADKVTEFLNGLESYEKAINKKPMKEVETFMQELIQKEGSIYEDNASTQLINRMLDQAKEETALRIEGQEEKKKEFVLVIDDLDRIDPHHIFRLFNVFAAHFDNRFNEKSNKFGFDKVIFVCDINNIRNIFSANYGTGTDFSGYIDKFYTYTIFHFNNTESVSKVVEDLVWEEMHITSNIRGFDTFYNKYSNMRENLISSIKEIVLQRKINLRTLLKFRGRNLLIENKKLQYSPHRTIDTWQLEALITIDILYRMIGDLDQLEAILNYFENIPKIHSDDERLRVSALIILNNREHLFEESKDGGKSLASHKWECKFVKHQIEYRFSLHENHMDRNYYGDILDRKYLNGDPKTNEPHTLFLLYKCLRYLRFINYY